jgi:hypothetical protein
MIATLEPPRPKKRAAPAEKEGGPRSGSRSRPAGIVSSSFLEQAPHSIPAAVVDSDIGFEWDGKKGRRKAIPIVQFPRAQIESDIDGVELDPVSDPAPAPPIHPEVRQFLDVIWDAASHRGRLPSPKQAAQAYVAALFLAGFPLRGGGSIRACAECLGCDEKALWKRVDRLSRRLHLPIPGRKPAGHVQALRTAAAEKNGRAAQ